MRIKSGSFLGLIIAGAGLSQAAFAAEEAKVTTAADSAKIGAEFRAEYNRNDQGLTKVQGSDPKATNTLEVQTVKIKLSGNINKNTEYKFRFNLLNPDPVKGPLDYGYGTHWFSDMMGFSIGKEKVMQGGWDTIDDSFKDHWTGAYVDNRAFDKYDNMIAFHAKVAGQINVQILNDKTTANGGEWNKNSHPTFAVGWLGKIGPVSPIVDFGAYDNQKSNWVDVGVKTEIAGLNARVDLRNQQISHKVGKDSKPDTGTGATVLLGYDVKNVASPWVYVSTYDKKENKDANAAGKDVKVNTMTQDAATGKVTYKFDDNKMVWGLGANFSMLGQGWTPYLAYVSTSGKFTDPVSGKEETKTQGVVRLGVLGEF